MTPYLVQVLLPLRTRTGVEVPAERFAEVRTALTDRFGGVTAYTRSPATGLWKRSDADVQRDQVIMIEVVVDVFDREWWAQYREQLEIAFDQEEIHARATAIEQI